MAAIAKNLAGSVAKGKLSEAEREAITGRIKPTTELAPAKECDLIIEAIIENKQAKLTFSGSLRSSAPAE
jgi:3-hydroxybutyryl-CoA dehydrogenase